MTASGEPIILNTLPERFREAAADLYLEAFWAKLGPILKGSRAAAVQLFAPTLRLDRAIAAVEGERLLGLAGYKDSEGAFIDTTLKDLQSAFGWFGGLWRGLALSLFERTPRSGELLMDGIVVAPHARGRGIGTRLLEAVEHLARERADTSIRLDVVDTNPDARRLYERFGFIPVKTERLSVLRPVFGFSASTEMRKTL